MCFNINVVTLPICLVIMIKGVVYVRGREGGRERKKEREREREKERERERERNLLPLL